MKRSAALVGLMSLLLGLSAYADVPKTIHYQGRITDLSTGNPITDGVYSVRISLYESQSATATAWSDLYDVQTQSGYFEASLGSNPVAPLNISFNKPYWIGIKVGADSEMSPRQPLSSVPYAQQVANGAITTSKLVDGAVTGPKILDGTIGTADIANTSITSEKMKPNWTKQSFVATYTLTGTTPIEITQLTTPVNVLTNSVLLMMFSGGISTLNTGYRSTQVWIEVDGVRVTNKYGCELYWLGSGDEPDVTVSINTLHLVGPGNHSIKVYAAMDEGGYQGTIKAGELAVMIFGQ